MLLLSKFKWKRKVTTTTTCLVMASVRLRKVIDTTRLDAQLTEVARELPKLRAQSG